MVESRLSILEIESVLPVVEMDNVDPQDTLAPISLVRPPASSTGASKSKASSSTTSVPITRKRRALLISEALPPVTDSATELPQTSIEDEVEDVDSQPLIHRSRKRLRLAETIEVPDPSVKTATLEELPLELDVEDSLDTNSPTVLSPNSPTISTSGLNFETAPTEVMTSFDNVFLASTEITSPSLVPVTPVYRSDNTATIADLFSIPALPSSIRLSFSSWTGILTIFVDPSILGSSHSGGLSPQSLPGPSRLPASSAHIEEIDLVLDTRVVPNPDPASSTLAISSEFEAMEEERLLSSSRRHDAESPKTVVLALFAPPQMKTKVEKKNQNPVVKRRRFGGASTIAVSVYKTSDLSCCDFLVREGGLLKLSGCAVISKGIVVVEGGNNNNKNNNNKNNNNNSCVKKYLKSMKVIWQGKVSKPSFGKFSILHSTSEFTARKFFADHGASHYWDIALNHTSN
ncbi:hypothetical protein BUALT_Bualt08G0019700 [Buddleja alternifolia]|uniref:Small nuclear ribonucleoprotein Prp3 C-terminal domain-containing protein n=1 Tax=Buddleja alternifolia TaxID=168488 RepID=A0AAV6X9I6_9LAMI|nr:hypothetical protein BUALT_Bualt08G0019700 [Buddleja alternifolia]